PSTARVNEKLPLARPEPPIFLRQGLANFFPAILTGAEHPATPHARCHGRIYLRDRSNPSSRHKYRVAAVRKPHFQSGQAANSHTHTDDRAKSRRAPACRRAHT